MSDAAPSRWTPQVLDVKAQEADRELFRLLHLELADVVEPYLLERIQGFTAGLASDFMGELETLKEFLLDEQRSGWKVDTEAGTRVELESQLAEFLQKSSAERKLTNADRDLARQLALEFAGAAWATIISWLNRQPRKEGLVDPGELLPEDLHRGQTALLEQVRADASQFEFTRLQVNLAMFRMLMGLAFTPLGLEPFVALPRGLRIERAALLAHLERAGKSYEAATNAIEYSAVLADYGIVMQQDRLWIKTALPIVHD
jgi:hypothetical protein